MPGYTTSSLTSLRLRWANKIPYKIDSITRSTIISFFFLLLFLLLLMRVHLDAGCSILGHMCRENKVFSMLGQHSKIVIFLERFVAISCGNSYLQTLRISLQLAFIAKIKFWEMPSVYVFSYFPFGFEGRIWDLIVSVPDHCLAFYFEPPLPMVYKMTSYELALKALKS